MLKAFTFIFDADDVAPDGEDVVAINDRGVELRITPALFDYVSDYKEPSAPKGPPLSPLDALRARKAGRAPAPEGDIPAADAGSDQVSWTCPERTGPVPPPHARGPS